jgi:hypothetical protein
MNDYQAQYIELNFERAALFKAIRDKYHCREVLYPGCSVHITPSLYFPHVIYVDQSETAAQFFADEKSILEFLNRNKYYKTSTYLRFIQQDYLAHLPLMEGKFDLLLSLFAGGIAKSCVKYLKTGGLFLTNNHQNDAVEAIRSGEFKLLAALRFQKGSYSISEDVRGTKLPVQKLNNRYLKRVNDSAQYMENETYYVFERSRETKKPESRNEPK